MHSKKLIYSEILSKKFNSQIYLKPEWYGETGSHKDMWAKSVIKTVLKRGFNKVVTMSSGNQGLALAAQAKKYNLPCIVLALKKIHKKYVLLFQKYKAQLILAKSPSECSRKFNSFVKKGYFPCSLTLQQRISKETIGIEGYKEISKEIVHLLGKNPDMLIIPTCYGDLAEGILQGFIDLKKSRLIKKIPQFILARAKSPKGDIAFSISTNTLTRYVKNVLQKTKGKSVFLINDDFINAKVYAKKELNLNLEYASAGSIAVLNKLNKKEIENKIIVCILTARDR